MSILKERQKTHGEYANLAFVAQSMKNILRDAPNYNSLSPVQRESVDLIATKLARIVCGNASEPDHWIDGAGYFQLVLNELQNKNTAPGNPVNKESPDGIRYKCTEVFDEFTRTTEPDGTVSITGSVPRFSKHLNWNR
jgi:hypothetical protein